MLYSQAPLEDCIAAPQNMQQIYPMILCFYFYIPQKTESRDLMSDFYIGVKWHDW